MARRHRRPDEEEEEERVGEEERPLDSGTVQSLREADPSSRAQASANHNAPSSISSTPGHTDR